MYLCATGSGLLWSATPQWEAGYREQLQKLVEARTWAMARGLPMRMRGRGMAGAAGGVVEGTRRCRAAGEVIRNEGAVLLASRWAGSFYKPVTVPGYTLYYSQHKDVLPGDQLERIRKIVRHDGWNYLTRVDHRMDPIYRRTEFNSENFNWMARMAGVFWSHEFGDRGESALLRRLPR